MTSLREGSRSIRAALKVVFELASIAALVVVVYAAGSAILRRPYEGGAAEAARIDGATMVNWTRAGRWIGDRQATVRVLLYTDYTCHFCADQDSVLQGLLEAYPNHVAVVVRHIPNPRSEIAVRLAIVSKCASRESTFEPIHRRLYKVAERGTTEEETFLRLLGVADTLALNRVRECFERREVINEIQNDIADAKLLGLSISPIMIVNGLVLPGFRGRQELGATLLAEMRRTESDFLAKRQDSTTNR